MKTISKLLLLSSLVVMSSCDLTEDPYGFYSEENFYQTADDAEAGLMYAYDAITYLEYSRVIFWAGGLPTDESTPKADEGVDVQDLARWNVANFDNNGMLTNYFKYAYIAINRANALIEQIPDADFEPELKDQYLGEAYFLRAWHYYNLAIYFGRVPVHTSTVETLDQTSAPLARNLDEIYDLIISDSDEAIRLLGYQQRLGRADKVAAQALAAKAYLYMASAKENGVPLYTELEENVTGMYAKAEEYAREVVYNQSEYGFEENLLNIYDVEQPSGPEHIFLMSMDRSGDIEGDYSKISKLFIPYIDGATIYLDDYDGTYSASHDGWSSIETNLSFYDSFDDSDSRKTVLMVDSVYNQEGELSAEYPGAVLYPFTRKYIDPDFIGDKTSTKPYLIRFSDIALVFAEAAGPTTEAYEQVNYIRNRAGLGDLPTGLSGEDFREAVLEERKYELAFEGNRLHDLRRHKLIQTIVPEASDLTDEEASFYPIPQREVNLNQGL
jgi:hypothetical protein